MKRSFEEDCKVTTLTRHPLTVSDYMSIEPFSWDLGMPTPVLAKARIDQCVSAWAYRDKQNRIICCAGCVAHSLTRAEVWTIMSRYSGPYMLAIARLLKAHISELRYLRIEALTQNDFIPGHRFLRLLGFTQEGVLKNLIGTTAYAIYAMYDQMDRLPIHHHE